MTKKKMTCGIIMPISPTEGYRLEHWSDVIKILKESLENSDFTPKIVSESDDVGVIHKSIVQNIYNSDIVVCDVSSKNPNVMFELGLRLAFDKPTIIVKDSITDYSFDTSLIEHLQYPVDLRFNEIVEFKENLRKKVIATYEKSVTDKNYSTFLKHFGNYKVAKLDETEISSQDYIISALDDLKSEIRVLRNNPMYQPAHRSRIKKEIDLLDNQKLAEIDSIINKHFDEFRKEYPVRRYKDLLLMRDEIYDYLESISEVREVCENGNILNEAITKFIFKN